MNCAANLPPVEYVASRTGCVAALAWSHVTCIGRWRRREGDPNGQSACYWGRGIERFGGQPVRIAVLVVGLLNCGGIAPIADDGGVTGRRIASQR
ncbi:Uncharacterised protein [Mycobacteroides abscessus subsp. abscessus]|nr:Uncharacterised protein [Mycobacteroides abscessus subsp. abscessus]